MRRSIVWPVVTAVFVVVAFAAGSLWRGRHQTQVEVARAKFFEAAQGQFHWPEGKKEWADMFVPLGSFDFSEYGPRWSFTAMYEGVQGSCDIQVVVKDVAGTSRLAVETSLARATPTELTLDLQGLQKQGINLKSVSELVLRMKSDGRAGRLLVSGLVNPRPALVRIEH
jgi:hypothetical protein